jgi:hypothetical protein
MQKRKRNPPARPNRTINDHSAGPLDSNPGAFLFSVSHYRRIDESRLHEQAVQNLPPIPSRTVTISREKRDLPAFPAVRTP